MNKILICGVLYKGDKILTTKRSMTKKIFPGEWEISGGHLEKNETHEQCLIREFKEEAGVDIKVGKLAYKYNFVCNYQNYTEYDYLATMKNESQEIILDLAENSEYKWISKNEVEKYFQNSLEKPAVEKGFEIILTADKK